MNATNRFRGIWQINHRYFRDMRVSQKQVYGYKLIHRSRTGSRSRFSEPTTMVDDSMIELRRELFFGNWDRYLEARN